MIMHSSGLFSPLKGQLNQKEQKFQAQPIVTFQDFQLVLLDEHLDWEHPAFLNYLLWENAVGTITTKNTTLIFSSESLYFFTVL